MTPAVSPRSASPRVSGFSSGPPEDPIEKAVLGRIPFEIIALSAVLAVPAALLFDPLTSLLFFGGGVLSALSFLWMKSAVSKVLARNKAGALRAGLFLYAVRFVLLLGVFLLIILISPKRIFALAAGFSTVVPVFAVEAARALLTIKKWKD
jgi:hypothetical protein